MTKVLLGVLILSLFMLGIPKKFISTVTILIEKLSHSSPQKRCQAFCVNFIAASSLFAGRCILSIRFFLTGSVEGAIKNYYSVKEINKDVEDGTLYNLLWAQYGKNPPSYAPPMVKGRVEHIKACVNPHVRGKWYCPKRPEILDELIGSTIPDDVFRKYNSPIILVWNTNRQKSLPVVINPRLNQFDFIKVFDPSAAFQELSMFVGTNLVRQMDPDVKHSDELKIEQHGFNEWSFRRFRK